MIVVMPLMRRRDGDLPRCRRGVLVQPEFRGGHTLTQDAFSANLEPVHRQAAQGAPQLVERKTGVETGPQNHVARRAGKAVEVEDLPHRHTIRWFSRKL